MMFEFNCSFIVFILISDACFVTLSLCAALTSTVDQQRMNLSRWMFVPELCIIQTSSCTVCTDVNVNVNALSSAVLPSVSWTVSMVIISFFCLFIHTHTKKKAISVQDMKMHINKLSCTCWTGYEAIFSMQVCLFAAPSFVIKWITGSCTCCFFKWSALSVISVFITVHCVCCVVMCCIII